MKSIGKVNAPHATYHHLFLIGSLLKLFHQVIQESLICIFKYKVFIIITITLASFSYITSFAICNTQFQVNEAAVGPFPKCINFIGFILFKLILNIIWTRW